MKNHYKIFLAVLAIAACKPETQPTPETKPITEKASIGSPLPQWEEGYLDIHSINTGRGESFYYILPDGTTMLVDAAGAADYEVEGVEDGSGIYSRPSSSYSSGSVIIKYIRHFAPKISNGGLDYFMTTHYHGDHMGIYTKNFGKYGWKAADRNGNLTESIDINAGGFVLNGVSEVGYNMPIRKLIDRGDWNDRPSNVYLSAPLRMQNYLNFIDWSRQKNGTVREKLAIGRNDQIALLHDAATYPQFSIRGIAAGGDIWTGNGTLVNTSYMPSSDELMANLETLDPNENIMSCVFTLTYGKFDWFSGGDIQYNDRASIPWKDMDKPVSKVVWQVEAMKANHHCARYTNSTDLLNVLKPDNVIIGIWTDNQPNPDTMKRIFKANSNVGIFATNLADKSVENLQASGIDANSFLARKGHIVLRVLPGGDSYCIYVIDDSDFKYNVTSIHGPYKCK
jgi:beta-lactamase superfamily II metal-dependent hydrolase